jgi:hypothetical protein
LSQTAGVVGPAPATAMPAPPIVENRSPRTVRRYMSALVIVLVLLAGGTLRWLDFPQRYEIRDGDETGYLGGGPQLIEGISPGYKAAPAGPQFWAEWAYEAADVARRLIAPAPQLRAVPWRLRPILALDNTLFDSYHDLSEMHRWIVGLNVTLALLACAAAAALGMSYAGWVGGLLIGGLFATWPMFVALSEQSRPYAGAWAFGMIGLWLAADANALGAKFQRARIWFAAIIIGLAIGSRIDMLTLLPLLWWISLDRAPSQGHLLKRFARLALASLLACAIAVFVAPWLITSLVGELRAIATVRFAATPAGHVPWSTTLVDYLGGQGAAVATLIAIVALFLQPPGKRLRSLVLALYWAVLFASLLKERGFGLHQHAEVFLTLLVLLAATLAALVKRFPRLGLAAVIVAVAVPLAISARTIQQTRARYVRDDLVPWVQQHVPAGTTVYISGWMMPSLLPTPQSSEILWNEATSQQAWRKKFESGLQRFGLTADQIPRALSEENLVQERGNRRGWFILGGHTDLPIPRYDIQIVNGSPILGVQDLSAALKTQGGIVIWRSNLPPPAELGTPLAQWSSPSQAGVQVYCTPDVRRQLKP